MILHGCALEKLKELADNSIDSVVTDPPYGLKFMSKHWDYDVPTVELWREVLRVLKPGGHLLSFGGTRTYHRLAVAIEDAGFEIRDQIQWIYGSGFPKSLDVSKAIDKAAGVERDLVPRQRTDGRTCESADWAQGWKNSSPNGLASTKDATTTEAQQWQGWGTALKPANEPIVMARKPLEQSTVAKNVVKYGTGAINIDASRIGTNDLTGRPAGKLTSKGHVGGSFASQSVGHREVVMNSGGHTQGRWPANLLFDDDAAAVLNAQTQHLHGAGYANTLKGNKSQGNIFQNSNDVTRFGDSGGASRFFYVAKASKSERNRGCEGMPEIKSDYRPGDEAGRNTIRERLHNSIAKMNHHPTVKPIKLMEYLITLVTPPGGRVLDPFAGSGSTGVAAKRLGFDYVLIEREAEYVTIAINRIAGVTL